MRDTEIRTGEGPAAARVVGAVLAGMAAAIAAGFSGGLKYAPAAGWIAAALTYLAWTWLVVGRMDPHQTATHATREDPTRPVTDVIMILASIASLAGVFYLLTAAPARGTNANMAALFGVASVVSAWFAVHTVFTLRYASLYYGADGKGIDFNQAEDPSYLDFAYLAFTMGMTYQVSDTDLQTSDIRATALRQALLSYLLGAVVLATAINLVVGLRSSR